MTGAGDIIKQKGDKVAEMKSMAGDVQSVAVPDDQGDPSMTRVQFVPKDYRVIQLLYSIENKGTVKRLWKAVAKQQ